MVSRALALLCLILTILLAWSDGWRTIRQDLTPTSENYAAEGYFFASEENQGEYQRLWWQSVPGTVESCGYALEVPYAAVWKSDEGGDGGGLYWLTLVLTASDDRFWDDGPKAHSLELEDSKGTRYRGTYQKESGAYYQVIRSDQGPFRAAYRLGLCLSDDPGEWVELRNLYGEPWNIRIEWGEVVPCDLSE